MWTENRYLSCKDKEDMGQFQFVIVRNQEIDLLKCTAYDDEDEDDDHNFESFDVSF